MHSRFALLIGVSDYRAFDHSAGQPRGTSDLYGPPQNLAAVLDFCHGVGFSAADVALLACPLVPPRGGHPALYAAATRDTVLEGVRLLATRLAASEASQGLIWFSGHGDAIEGVGPVLCVEDTVLAEGELHQVVTLAEIGAILEAHAPGRAVTLVLDSCSSGTPPAGSTRTLGRMRATARLRDGDTLISATANGQVGVEIQVDGTWRGALTWALCTAAAPYARKSAHGFVVPDLSTTNWVERATMLLRGVSVTQKPQLRGHGAAVVLQPTGVPEIRVTSRLADQRRGDVEIWAGESGQMQGDEPVWLRFDLHNPTTNGVIGQLVTSYQTTGSTLVPYSDCWTWQQGSAWPSSFEMDFVVKGTVGVDTPPSLPPGPAPMMAFPPGLNQSSFGSQSTSGYQVWGIVEPSVPSTILGYLLRNTTTGALKWLITWPGYSQRGALLADLPNVAGSGGVMLSDDSSTLWFMQLSPTPSTLGQVVPAYNVNQAFTA